MHQHWWAVLCFSQAKAGVGQQADGKHMIQMAVAQEDMVDAGDFFLSEVTHAGAGVDEDVVIDEE
jgi:hypothetical protein